LCARSEEKKGRTKGGEQKGQGARTPSKAGKDRVWGKKKKKKKGRERRAKLTSVPNGGGQKNKKKRRGDSSEMKAGGA